MRLNQSTGKDILMRYTTIEGSELNVSSICLGTWAIGGDSWGEYDEKNAVAAIETAIERGINFIDTAPAYGRGHAEKLIAPVIAKHRDRVVIATKCGLDITRRMIIDLSPDFIRSDCEGSLKRLGIETIDLYQCHWPDPKTPMDASIEALVRLKEEGKIRYIGVSNFNAAQVAEASTYTQILTLQPHYSLLERSIEKETLPLCRERKISVISYGSLGAGVLTGKYVERPVFRRDDSRSFFYRFFREQYWPKVMGLVDAVKRIADERGVKPGHVAVAWILSHPGFPSAIVGVRSPEQVYDNLGGAELVLSAEEIERLNTLSEGIYS